MEDFATGGSGSQAYAWHFDMLHDHARINAFSAAFERLPIESLRTGVALDIGCGSGVLGMMLLKKQPSLKQVVAVDVDKAVVKVAKENAQLSGLKDKMMVHALHSTRIASLADVGAAVPKVPLLVCEILDAGLLGEDCIRTLRHAAGSLLTPGYHAVPARADIYACVVESDTLTSWQHLHRRSRFAPKAYRHDDGDGNPHDVAFDRLLQYAEAKVLSPEFHATGIDFENLPTKSSQVLVDVEITQTGRLDAIVFWWRCFMVRDDRIATMTNAPSWAKGEAKTARGEVDHWRQAVCILPRPSRHAVVGERIVVAVMHDDDDIWFRIVHEDCKPPLLRMPKASTQLSYLSYQRMWMLNDNVRLDLLNRAVHQALRSFTCNSWQEHSGILVVDLSDGPVLSIFALQALAKMESADQRRRNDRPASRRLRRILSLVGRRPTVMCLESSENICLAKEMVSPLSRKLARMGTSNFRRAPVFSVVADSPMISPRSVSLMMAEPYSQTCDGQPCDAHLWQLWAQTDALAWTLAENAILLPSRFRVMAVLVNCPALWYRRQQITTPVAEGVDVSAINGLHPDVLENELQASMNRPRKRSRKAVRCQSYRSCFAVGMWQNHHNVLGYPVCVCEVDLREPMPQQCHTFAQKAQFRVTHASLAAHAIATWAEIEIASGEWFQLGAPTGSKFPPSYSLQGLLLAQNLEQQEKYLDLCARFDPDNGSLQLKASWNGELAF